MLRRAAFLTGSIAATALFAAPGGYVDPQLCAGCHATIARNYAQTGMGRSFRAVMPQTALPEFNGSSFLHSPSRELFTFTRRDGAAYIRRSQPGPNGAATNIFEERVDYVIGSGNQAISYLHRTRDNKLTEFPVSWYPENGGHWQMSPAYDRPDHPGFSREVNFACMQCHNANPVSGVADEAPVSDSPGETIFPARLPNGIDCQRCHGPGQNHVEAATRGRPAPEIRAAIVDPARLNAERQSEVCLQCHLETTSSRLPASLLRIGRGIFSYRPGESLADFILAFERASGAGQTDSVELVSAPYRLAKSSCVQANGKPLACITCHDPHLALSREESVRKTNGVCASCHQQTDSTHPHATDCVSCHMPQTKAADVIHATITDHFISRPHGDTPPVVETNARNVPPFAGEVMLYYPKVLPRSVDTELSLAISEAQSNPAEALARLNELTTGDFPATPETAAEIGHAFLLLAQPGKALSWYRQALEKSPGNWSYLSGLGNAQQAAGHPDLAAETFARVAALAPWETDVLFSLGQAYGRQGKFADAVRALQDAVSRNPESAVAYNDLGSTLLRMAGSGDADALPAAEAALREAVRMEPEFASLRMNLADALIREHKLSEAQEQVEEAIRLGGRAETSEAAWFATLLSGGNPEQALKAWNASFTTQVAGAHNNLGTVFAAENKPDDAIREYRLAVAGNAQSALAQFNLGLTLFSRGLKAEAIPLLQKSAVSNDPGIRAAAEMLLNQK